MEQRAYNFIEQNENNHWWFRARKNILKRQLLNYGSCYPNVLDIGCGTGVFLRHIKDLYHSGKGLDHHKYGSSDVEIIIGEAENLPFKDNSLDLVTALDVIEHIEDANKVIREIKRVLNKDGLTLITVPALQFLYSPHDKHNNHIKRYYKKELKKLLEDNGFKVLKCTYFNTILSPIEFIVRFLEKILDRELITENKTEGFLNNILYKIFNMETNLLSKYNFPFGLSLLIIAKPVK